MILNGVDFPEQLIEAQKSGRLVIFAGAGVSVNPPSALPDFNQLAKQVALETKEERPCPPLCPGEPMAQAG